MAPVAGVVMLAMWLYQREAVKVKIIDFNKERKARPPTLQTQNSKETSTVKNESSSHEIVKKETFLPSHLKQPQCMINAYLTRKRLSVCGWKT